jgi:hypothetical protein
MPCGSMSSQLEDHIEQVTAMLLLLALAEVRSFRRSCRSWRYIISVYISQVHGFTLWVLALGAQTHISHTRGRRSPRLVSFPDFPVRSPGVASLYFDSPWSSSGCSAVLSLVTLSAFPSSVPPC